MKKILLTMMCIFALSGIVFADSLPDPKPTRKPKTEKSDKSKVVPLIIRTQSGLEQPTLTISKKQMKKLLAETGEFEEDDSSNLASSGLRVKTFVSGIFLSLAFIFGGIFLARGKSLGKNQKTVAILLGVSLTGAAASTIYANVAPPFVKGIDETILSEKVRNNWRGAYDDVKIVVVNDDVESIKLEIPKVKNSKANDKEE